MPSCHYFYLPNVRFGIIETFARCGQRGHLYMLLLYYTKPIDWSTLHFEIPQLKPSLQDHPFHSMSQGWGNPRFGGDGPCHFDLLKLWYTAILYTAMAAMMTFVPIVAPGGEDLGGYTAKIRPCWSPWRSLRPWKQVLLFCMAWKHGELNGRERSVQKTFSEGFGEVGCPLRCWKTARKTCRLTWWRTGMIWWQSYANTEPRAQGFFKMMLNSWNAGNTSKLWSFFFSQNLWWRKVNGDPF